MWHIIRARPVAKMASDSWKIAALERLAFTAFWSVVLGVTVASHDFLPRAQAYVRASTVPLGIAGLAIVFDGFAIEQLTPGQVALPATLTLAVVELAYILGFGSMVGAALAVVFAVGLLLKGKAGSKWTRSILVTVLLTMMSSVFTFHYVDYLFPRIGKLPASALLLTARSLAASLILVGTSVTVRTARRLADHLADESVDALSIVGVACLQLAYFYVDWFADPRMRFVHVILVGAAAVGVVALWKPSDVRGLRLGPLTAVGLLCLICLQFAYFYADSLQKLQSTGVELTLNESTQLKLTPMRPNAHPVVVSGFSRTVLRLTNSWMGNGGRAHH